MTTKGYLYVYIRTVYKYPFTGVVTPVNRYSRLGGVPVLLWQTGEGDPLWPPYVSYEEPHWISHMDYGFGSSA